MLLEGIFLIQVLSNVMNDFLGCFPFEQVLALLNKRRVGFWLEIC